MAVSLQRRGNGRQRHRPMAEINVTPMVDVMLVLLIVGVPVDLPKSNAPAINENKEPLVITVNADGDLFIQNEKLDSDSLVPKLQAITNNNPEAVIYVRGDKAINYGRVMEVMGLIASAGFTKVSLVAELPQGKGADKH
jgi:biopolymer transport protein TolR